MAKYLDRFTIITLFLSCMMLNGCFYGTRFVSNIGIRSEVISGELISPSPVLTNDDGAILLKVKTNYFTPIVSNGYVTSSGRKYLLGTRTALECSIDSALKSYEITRIHRISWKDRVPDNVLVLTSFPFDREDDNCGWQLMPSSFGSSAVEDMILKSFKPAPSFMHKDSTYYPYQYQGNNYALTFRVGGAQGNKEIRYYRRMWWGYPFQILILPAIPFDIVTWPIQLLFTGKIIDG